MNIKNFELQEIASKKLSNDELMSAFDELLTQEKQKFQKIKEEYDRISVIINLIPNTISWVNEDKTYFGVNKALADACNQPAENFIGRPIGFHTKERFFYEFVTDLFKAKGDTIYRELEVNINGMGKTYLVSGTKLEDKSKAVVIGVDITELVKLKTHVSFTEKLVTLGEMFAGIIHDINNPLQMIDANAKRIKKKIQDNEVHEILNKIEMSVRKVSKIVHGIKVFVRQDSLPGEQMANENLGAIIDDAIVICENKLKTHEVAIRIEHKINDVTFPCHFTQIFQVFVNLISNSIDAISSLSDKWIEISVEELSDKYIVKFQDSGNGIPKEIQEKIFQAFFTTKNRGVGSGLGLSLCSKILEAHGGRISIDNSASHTTFLIELKKINKV